MSSESPTNSDLHLPSGESNDLSSTTSASRFRNHQKSSPDQLKMNGQFPNHLFESETGKFPNFMPALGLDFERLIRQNPEAVYFLQSMAQNAEAWSRCVRLRVEWPGLVRFFTSFFTNSTRLGDKITKSGHCEQSHATFLYFLGINSCCKIQFYPAILTGIIMSMVIHTFLNLA